MTRQELSRHFLRKQREQRRLRQAKEYEQAIQILEELRKVPGMMEIEELRAEILYELACGYSLLGRKKKAVSYLKEALDTNLIGVLSAEYSRDLDPVRGEAGYKEIVSRHTAALAFWDNPSFSTPYRKNISTNDKIAGLSKLWAEVKYNFAYFDNVPEVDWNELYLSYLPKVRKSKSTLEYYLLLQEMLAQLKDGHTSIYYPAELQEFIAWRPCMNTELIEDKVLVSDAPHEALRKDGVRLGLEVIAVDGMPVHEYADRKVRPYQSASTRQALDRMTYWAFLLSGSKDSTVTVMFADERGKTFERVLPRLGAGWIGVYPPVELKMLGENIAYAAVNTMGDDTMPETFDSMFPSIEKADALIIDVRRNGGGSSHNGYRILGYLTDRPFKSERVNTRGYFPFRRARGCVPGWVKVGFGERSPNGDRHFAKPVVVLIGPDTCSAAEDFCVAFDVMKRGKMIGEGTSGSTGQPLIVSLPGGGRARVCTPTCTYPDGREFVGVGIQPDIRVRPTVADVRAGRDTVLEAALDYLGTVTE